MDLLLEAHDLAFPAPDHSTAAMANLELYGKGTLLDVLSRHGRCISIGSAQSFFIFGTRLNYSTPTLIHYFQTISKGLGNGYTEDLQLAMEGYVLDPVVQIVHKIPN